jgi:hypothetical protein
MSIKQVSASNSAYNWQPTDVTFDDACDKLREAGYKELGQGTFSTVFANNSMSVIKVSKVKQNMNALHWLMWCKANPCKYVPKVGQIDLWQTQAGQHKYFVAIVERFSKGATCNILKAWRAIHGVNRGLNRNKEEVNFTSDDASKVKRSGNLDLYAVIQAILSLNRKGYADQDMTLENLYMRGSATDADNLVFVDPLTGGN